jgi:plastocyanin
VVTWTNMEGTTHTVVSNSGSEMGSGNLGNGQAYSHAFPAAGTYAYHCGLHPSMTGMVIVGS